MSSRISEIADALEEFRLLNEHNQQRLAGNPTSKADLFFSKTSATRVAQLEQDLRVERLKRARELLQVHLHGGPIGHGSAPLALFAHFLASFGDAIENAAYRIFSGSAETKKVPREVQQQLDLRVVGLEAGSMGINISGRLSPDLGGSPALETTLHQLFDVVESSGDGFYDALDSIGHVAARSFANALKPLQDHDTSLDLKWVSPEGRERSWSADSATLAELRSRFNSLGDPEVFVQIISGEIVGLSASGRIDLQRDNAERARVKFGQNQAQAIAKLHLWSSASLSVRTERSFDRARQRYVERHWLRDELDHGVTTAGGGATDR